MSEERTIRIEEVAHVEAPPKARVADAETAPEKLERKRDYLEGFKFSPVRFTGEVDLYPLWIDAE